MNTNDLIIVAYFHGSPLPNLKFKHNEEFAYTKEKRNYILDTVLEAGYNVMFQQIKGTKIGEGNTLIILSLIHI